MGFRNFREATIVGKVLMVFGGLAMAVVFALLFGFVVLWLWNWLMPVIFGLPVITYWQAWGLVLLSHVLFKAGHWGPRSRRDQHWKAKMRRRFEHPSSHEDGDGEESYV